MMRSGFAAASRSLPPRNSQRMRILLARHGETPWNAEGRYQG
ncbi:histidine phosphatase family protein, partial [Xanthomonas oryzae]